MVYVSFVDNGGRGMVPEDKTTFLYSGKDLDAMKQLVDGVTFGIFRDARRDNKELELLIRIIDGQPCIALAVEMIPVKGQIHHVKAPWNNDSELNYNYITFSHRDGIQIATEKNGPCSSLDVWYSKEGYLREHPDSDLNTDDVVRVVPE